MNNLKELANKVDGSGSGYRLLWDADRLRLVRETLPGHGRRLLFHVRGCSAAARLGDPKDPNADLLDAEAALALASELERYAATCGAAVEGVTP